MKATGIVRRVDELGRFVIPVELRKTLMIEVGDQLEVFTDTEGRIILTKYQHDKSIKDALTVLKKQVSQAEQIKNQDDILEKLNEISELLQK